jgi:hypothetical protein
MEYSTKKVALVGVFGVLAITAGVIFLLFHEKAVSEQIRSGTYAVDFSWKEGGAEIGVRGIRVLVADKGLNSITSNLLMREYASTALTTVRQTGVRDGSGEVVMTLMGNNPPLLSNVHATVLEPRIEEFMFAAETGDVDSLGRLLERGHQVNERDLAGRTALMYTVIDDKVAAARYLLERGAQIDATDKSGSTALMYAADSGRFAIAKLLVAAGADLHVEDKQGYTAEAKARSSQHLQIAEYLSRAGSRRQ